jgi:hypothetical protein
MLDLLKNIIRASNPIQQYGDITRQRIADVAVLPGSYRSGSKPVYAPAFNYWCKCGTKLTDGPCGGAAVNAVCEKCHINYGCLDGYHGD